jgi:hypothetical protein
VPTKACLGVRLIACVIAFLDMLLLDEVFLLCTTPTSTSGYMNIM